MWETVSFEIKKYKPFLNIDVTKYKASPKRAGNMSRFFESEMVRDTVMDLRKNATDNSPKTCTYIGTYSKEQKQRSP